LINKVPTPIKAAILGATIATLKNGKYPDEKTKITTYGETVFQMADYRSLEGIKTLPPESLKNMSDMVLEYYDSVGANAAKQIEDAGLKLQWEMVGGTPVLAYAPGSKKDDVKLTELNKIYSNHMRNSMQALSHLQGHTDYQRTFSEFVEGKTEVAQTQEKWIYEKEEDLGELYLQEDPEGRLTTMQKPAHGTQEDLKRDIDIARGRVTPPAAKEVPPEVPQNPSNSLGRRKDGTEKGLGYFGKLKVPGTNGVATEYSIGVNIDGKEVEIPSLVPTLTAAEVQEVLKAAAEDKPVSKAIQDKAAAFAISRMKAGKSPFAGEGEQGYTPQPTPAPRKARGATVAPQAPSKPLPLPEVKVTGPKDIYKPAPALPADKAAQNKALMDGLKDKANIAKAEMDVAGDNNIHPTMQGEIKARLGVIARAKAEGKEPPPYVSTDVSRIKKGEKWYYHSSNNKGSFIYEPKNKVFLFLDKEGTATIEKRIGKKLLDMPKVGDIK
jgi:hypothetical protein